jgi:hypothetical protein
MLSLDAQTFQGCQRDEKVHQAKSHTAKPKALRCRTALESFSSSHCVFAMV